MTYLFLFFSTVSTVVQALTISDFDHCCRLLRALSCLPQSTPYPVTKFSFNCLSCMTLSFASDLPVVSDHVENNHKDPTLLWAPPGAGPHPPPPHPSCSPPHFHRLFPQSRCSLPDYPSSRPITFQILPLITLLALSLPNWVICFLLLPSFILCIAPITF